jgi:hypothetical protein
MFLISFRNKLFVMLGWIYDYIGHSREARLITGQVKLRVRELRGVEQRRVNPAQLAETQLPR